ncbi:MAG: response regulator [Deltaproteobacteria bacterium]
MTKRECKMFTTKGKRILIIDDDEDITNLFNIFLEYDGYKVDAFTDPIDALYSFRRNVYDLVLLDLKMPRMNGMILISKIEKYRSCSIILFYYCK